jgi:phage-related tail protein
VDGVSEVEGLRADWDEYRTAAVRADTQRHLRLGTGCQSCAENVLALLDRVQAAEDALAALRAGIEAKIAVWRRAIETVGAADQDVELVVEDFANALTTLTTPADQGDTAAGGGA